MTYLTLWVLFNIIVGPLYGRRISKSTVVPFKR